jgi:hypothetical protein
MTSSLFRRLISGSLTFVFLIHTWRSQAPPFPELLTTWDLIPAQRPVV